MPAFAQDMFAVQVYDSETAPLGSMGAELHLHYFSRDSRSMHLTLEPAEDAVLVSRNAREFARVVGRRVATW